MGRNGPIGGWLPIELQLLEERASALKRVADVLERQLEQLAELEREIRTLAGSARAKKVSEYHELRAKAERQRWYLVVQREAIGLTRHDDLEVVYPLPPPIA